MYESGARLASSSSSICPPCPSASGSSMASLSLFPSTRPLPATLPPLSSPRPSLSPPPSCLFHSPMAALEFPAQPPPSSPPNAATWTPARRLEAGVVCGCFVVDGASPRGDWRIPLAVHRFAALPQLASSSPSSFSSSRCCSSSPCRRPGPSSWGQVAAVPCQAAVSYPTPFPPADNGCRLCTTTCR